MNPIKKITPTNSISILKDDFKASLVVFFASLPLCLGIALASGAPLVSGIFAGIIGGTIVALISKSHLNVSGPDAGLTLIVFSSISFLNSYNEFLLALVLAGVIQFIFGLLRVGIVGYFFPSSVIKGLLAAIGIILILKELPYILGYDKAKEFNFIFKQTNGENTFSEISSSISTIHYGALIIASISLLFLIVWDVPKLKNYFIFKNIPAILFIVLSGIFINVWFKFNWFDLYLADNKLLQLPNSKSVPDFIKLFTLPDFQAISNYKVYIVAMSIALLSSIKSLLSIEATDKLDPFKRTTPSNQELKAQGIGNIISGLVGGLPISASIARSSANIAAGAKTKNSVIFHALLLLMSLVFLSPILNKIPISCLAALLIFVGYKLTKFSLFKSMYKLGIDQFLPFIVTIIAILLTDLLKGVGVGMLISLFFIFRNNFKRPFSIIDERDNDKSTIFIFLDAEITFLNKGSLVRLLSKLPENSTVIIDGTESKSIDIDVIEMLHDFENSSKLKNIHLELINIPPFSSGIFELDS